MKKKLSLKIGGVLKLSNMHWITRKENTRFVYTVVNVVGGEMSYAENNLRAAVSKANALNDRITTMGRVL
jgi:hypothetical protein